MRRASMSGVWLGRHDTPVASVMVVVIASALAMKRSGHGMFSHCAVKCSPIHASSKPRRSRVTSWARSSSIVPAGSAPGGCSGMAKYPRRMREFYRIGPWYPRFTMATTTHTALLDDARRTLDETVDLRRRLHRHPEIGLALPRTQQTVLDALAGLPLTIRTGQKTTSVVATLEGARPGPTVLLRADMDALPLQEDTGLPFASEVDGNMHACGHDTHVAMLASSARLLADRRDPLRGRGGVMV